MKRFLPLALIVGLALTSPGCAATPFLHSTQAQITAKRLETGAEVAMNAAEELWIKHNGELTAAHQAQASVLIHRIPSLRKSLRHAEALGNADSLAGQISEAVALAKAATSIITGDSPAAAAEVAANQQ